jgi:hypothetical protein
MIIDKAIRLSTIQTTKLMIDGDWFINLKSLHDRLYGCLASISGIQENDSSRRMSYYANERRAVDNQSTPSTDVPVASART